MRYELSEMYTQTARSWAIQNRLGLLATEDLEDILAEANPPLLYTHNVSSVSARRAAPSPVFGLPSCTPFFCILLDLRSLTQAIWIRQRIILLFFHSGANSPIVQCVK